MSGLSAWNQVQLLVAQIGRHTGLKALLLPLAIKEPGLCVKVAARKVSTSRDLFTDRRPVSGTVVQVAVSIESRVESHTALKNAVDACEALARYAVGADRLEAQDGKPIPNLRLEIKPHDDDGLLEDPAIR
jgi:hypothetical protein